MIITAILVRVRSEAIENGGKTSYSVKVRNTFKATQPMRKKLEIRFDNGGCSCKTVLLLKRDYLVFGKHAAMNGSILFLEVDRQSFIDEWDTTLEKTVERLEKYCSKNSMARTPRMSTSSQFTKTKITTTGMNFFLFSLKKKLNTDTKC